MSYFVNQDSFSAGFFLPCDIADKYLKLATPTQLKVIIYIMRNISSGIDSSIAAEALSLPVSEVEDALVFWSQCKILKSDKKTDEIKEVNKSVIDAKMPSRTDVIKRGMEDSCIMFMLREAQLKFGRNLKQNESSLLVSLYDDYGMDVSVILLLLQHAVNEGKCNMAFIKSTASKWMSAGVETVVEAEEKIADTARQKLSWSIVERVFGIEKRKPSDRELELSDLWINKWKFGEDILKLGYDTCVNAKTKLDMRYIAKVFENWHKAGYTTAKAVNDGENFRKKTDKGTKQDFAGYDLDLFEKMLNED